MHGGNDQAGADPQQRYHRHQPLHQACNAFDACHDDHQGRGSQHRAGYPFREIKRVAQSVRHRVGLYRVENKTVSQEQKNRKQHAHPAHTQAARHVPGRAAAKLTVPIPLFVELRQRTFGKRRRHADKRCDPHPEHGTRAACANG